VAVNGVFAIDFFRHLVVCFKKNKEFAKFFQSIAAGWVKEIVNINKKCRWISRHGIQKLTTKSLRYG